jgi:hypothetical protein
LALLFARTPENNREIHPNSVHNLLVADGIVQVLLLRENLLNGLCFRLLAELGNYHIPLSPPSKPLSGHGGRPPLSREEIVLRMALGLIEEHLQKKDKNAKRGEVLLLAIETLHIPTKIEEIKDGVTRLKRARKMDDHDLLDSAHDQFQSWLSRLSF